VPANDLNDQADDGDKSRDYVGIRWGISVTGFQRGSEVHRAAVDAYNRFLAVGTAQTQRLQNLLFALPENGLEPCIRILSGVQSLDAETMSAAAQACGGAPVSTDPTVVTALQEAIQRARIQADSRYFGIDVRADFGDLTLAAVDTARGVSFAGAAAWGRRFGFAENATTGVRAFLGSRFWELEGSDEGNLAIEGGLGFEAIRYYDLQRLTLLAQFDFRRQIDSAVEGGNETRIDLRGSINVPVTATTSVALNFSRPIIGEGPGPVLSIKANWRLLWSEAF
jgi:hypothetical protein